MKAIGWKGLIVLGLMIWCVPTQSVQAFPSGFLLQQEHDGLIVGACSTDMLVGGCISSGDDIFGLHGDQSGGGIGDGAGAQTLAGDWMDGLRILV